MVQSPGHKMQFFAAYIARIGSHISTVGILMMMTLILLEVILRQLGWGIDGVFELTGLFLILITFFSLAHCWNQEGHIRIDMIFNSFSLKMKSAASGCTAIFGFLFFGAIMIGAAKSAITAFKRNEISVTLGFPLYPIKVILVVGCAIFCFQLLLSFIACMSQCFKKTQDMKGK